MTLSGSGLVPGTGATGGSFTATLSFNWAGSRLYMGFGSQTFSPTPVSRMRRVLERGAAQAQRSGRRVDEPPCCGGSYSDSPEEYARVRHHPTDLGGTGWGPGVVGRYDRSRLALPWLSQ